MPYFKQKMESEELVQSDVSFERRSLNCEKKKLKRAVTGYGGIISDCY